MKTFYIRAASAAVFSIAMLVGIFGGTTPFALLMAIILMGSLNEYFRIIPRISPISKVVKWAIITLYTAIYYLTFITLSNDSGQENWVVMLSVGGLLVFITALYSHTPNPFDDLGWRILPMFWILIPLILTCKIYVEKGSAFVLAIFAVIWIFDTGCYIVGSLLGKHKLFERVSPKKTWEGLAGGVVLALVPLFFANRIPELSMFSWWKWLIIGVAIIIASTFGDLVESLLKRNLGVKDSGKMLPGHGGFLDRFDSFFFAAPFAELAIRILERIAA